MTSYLLRRGLQALVALLLALTVVFLIVRLSGDPVSMMLGEDATPDQIAQLRNQLGLDRPVYLQYLSFLRSTLRGRMGESFRHRRPVFELVASRLPATLQLAGLALVLTLIVGLTSGTLAALKQGSVWDSLAMTFAVVGQAVPRFWLGLVLILVFGLRLQWLPVSGRGSFAHLILPGLTLAAASTARLARIMRSSLLEIVHEDYIRTAKSKGLSSSRIIVKHALRPSLVSPVTLLALEVGALVGHAVVIEMVFAWPGIGRLGIQAIWARDYPVLLGVVVFMSALFIALNLIADVAHALLDPRVSYG